MPQFFYYLYPKKKQLLHIFRRWNVFWTFTLVHVSSIVPNPRHTSFKSFWSGVNKRGTRVEYYVHVHVRCLLSRRSHEDVLEWCCRLLVNFLHLSSSLRCNNLLFYETLTTIAAKEKWNKTVRSLPTGINLIKKIPLFPQIRLIFSGHRMYLCNFIGPRSSSLFFL